MHYPAKAPLFSARGTARKTSTKHNRYGCPAAEIKLGSRARPGPAGSRFMQNAPLPQIEGMTT